MDFELFKITQAYEKMQIAQYSEALIHTLIEFNFKTKSNIWQMSLPDDWLSELCFFLFQPVLYIKSNGIETQVIGLSLQLSHFLPAPFWASHFIV